MRYFASYACAILFTTLVTLSGCTDSSKQVDEDKATAVDAYTDYKIDDRFEVISEEKKETSLKAQLLEYAWYKDTIYSKDALTKAILEIYNFNKDKDVFENYDAPSVMAVYLFTSKEAMKDKAEWIAMLSKGPGDLEPRVIFNEFKLTALNTTNDNVKSRDEIELDKLKSYFTKRGLEVCELADLLKKIELENIHKADAKYPDYGEEHMAMIHRLDAQSYRKLKAKYKLSDDMLSKVSVFGMAYCK